MTMLSSLGRQSLTTAFGWAAKSKLWNKLWYFLMTVFDDRHSLGSYFRSLRWHCKYFFFKCYFFNIFWKLQDAVAWLLDAYLISWRHTATEGDFKASSKRHSFSLHWSDVVPPSLFSFWRCWCAAACTLFHLLEGSFVFSVFIMMVGCFSIVSCQAMLVWSGPWCNNRSKWKHQHALSTG